jgi:SAM-dependent methyltransferase
MSVGDDDNSILADLPNANELVRAFFEEYPYAAPLKVLARPGDRGRAARMVCQDVGDWGHRRVPSENARVWVAGCGSLEAVKVALEFPSSTVLGTDISEASIRAAADLARRLGLQNLTLQRAGLEDAPYSGEFDLILSTGVIHHTPDPALCLSRMSKGLTPDGLLLLMVHNKFQRMKLSAFQRAVRLLAGTTSRPDYGRELELAKALLLSLEDTMGYFTSMRRDLDYLPLHEDPEKCPPNVLASLLVQPIVFGYTVESFIRLCESAALKVVSPFANRLDRLRKVRVDWNVRLEKPELQNAYDSLADEDRWQLTNLLRYDKSPRMWFYCQREDCQVPIKTERLLCAEFLAERFRRADRSCTFDQIADGSPAGVGADPQDPTDSVERSVLAAVDERMTMRETLARLNIPTDFQTVHGLRVNLATWSFPFLEVVR